MQSLPAPAWRLGRRAAARGGRWGPLAVVLAVLVALIVLAVALSSGADDARPDASQHLTRAQLNGSAALINGHALQSADCTDWNAGSAGERASVIDALRANVGGATGQGPAVTLADSEAAALFGRACTGTIGRGWLLYVLYTRAAGFQSLQR